jgi:hypothetical protein
MVSHIFSFVTFVPSTILDHARLSPWSDMFHTIPTMCKEK